jgi:Ca2+-binding EF-hand superfamily protein
MTLSPKEMAKSISELKEAIKFLTLNTDRLLEANKMIMSLEQDDEPVTEEELDKVVKGGMH